MTNVFSLQQIFDGKVLKVPDYQRGYAWERVQREELLEDLEFLAPGKDHYTGSLVLHRQAESVMDEGGKQNAVFHVVDGQQRLTTLVVLLDALRASFVASKPALAAGILTSYIRFPDENGQSAYKLHLHSDCHDYFTHNVLDDALGPQGPTIASHQRLREARQHFSDYLQEKAKELGEAFPTWAKALHDKITQRLKVGQYFVSDSTEVGVIFEVMNNRGKPLSELEKVKNYLLYLASKLDVNKHDLEQKINAGWAEIFRCLMAAGLTAGDDENRFLRAHWLMAYDPVPKNWEGSKSIKEKFHLRIDAVDHKKLLDQVGGYVSSLRDSVLAFSEVFAPLQAGAFSAYPKHRQAELREEGAKLPRTGALSAFIPALMAVRLSFPTDADAYLGALRLFERYAFRVYRWQGKYAHTGQTRLFRLGHDLYHKHITFPDMSRQVRLMALFHSPDWAFSEGFEVTSARNFYLWPGLRYFLYEYELHLAKGHHVKMSWEDLAKLDLQRTIEHILPQNPKCQYWLERFDEAARQTYTNHIGNLSLTFNNSTYGNKPYPEKRGGLTATKACYATAPLFMEQKLARDFADWNEKALLMRVAQIKHWALQRWHIDSADLQMDAGEPGVTVEEDEEV